MTTLTLKFGDLEVEVTGDYVAPHDPEGGWYFAWGNATINGVSIVPLLDSLGDKAFDAFTKEVDTVAFTPDPPQQRVSEDYDWLK